MVLSAAAVLTVATPATAANPSTATTAAPAEGTLTGMLNNERTSRGVPALTRRLALVRVARAQARRMAARNLLHHNPDLTTDVANWRWVGENVGYGPDAPTVHAAFMGSAAHRANILDGDYTELGIGAVAVNGRVWVAEVFRRPLHARTGRARVATFQHTLRLGSRGADVRRLQTRLGVRQTFSFDRRTSLAVGRFQTSMGWRGRGNCGGHTWSRLF